jgi:hypothetical protein
MIFGAVVGFLLFLFLYASASDMFAGVNWTIAEEVVFNVRNSFVSSASVPPSSISALCRQRKVGSFRISFVVNYQVLNCAVSDSALRGVNSVSKFWTKFWHS